MAPLPQNNTARVFYDYVTGSNATSREHTFQVRVATADDVPAAHQAVTEMLTALTSGQFAVGWKLLRARFQASGAPFSVPTELPPGLTTFLGSSQDAYNVRYEAVESTFQGRSGTSGRRVDLSLYRARGDAQDNFRIEAGASGMPAAVSAAVSALQDASNTGVFLCIDATAPTWYPYLNENYNSYWETRARLG